MQNSDSLKKVYKALKTTQAKLAELENAQQEAIAIIGMGCRFPGGANNPEAFWAILEQGIDTITDVPSTRWNAKAFYDPDPEVPGKMYTTKGGFLNEDIEGFDHHFFRLSPKEVQSLDPQQRLLLEVSWEALENAGIAVETLKGSKTGVFVGLSNSDYSMAHLRSGDFQKIGAYSMTGIAFSTATGRLAYLHGFEGPNLVIDTACSSALVAIHLACQSLRTGESELALVGGVNIILTPEAHIGFCKLKALAPDGRCKTFDASADGYSRGEGCGIVVMKRLSAALTNGDNILAVIKGTAINQDGKSNGLTAPNGVSQQKVIRNALTNAGLTAAEIDYIEAHGTGTPLGDPIEIDALAQVYGKERHKNTPLFVGGVKANLGHLEPAAGIAAFIKTILILNHEKIPPQPNFQTPNPEIPWEQLPIKIPTTLTPWLRTDNKPRTGGVSSFSFSGTNAHIIVQEAPLIESKHSEIERSHHLLTLSAKSQQALDALATKYVDYLATTDNTPVLWESKASALETVAKAEALDSNRQNSIDSVLGEVCYTANVGRSHFPYRLSIIGTSKAEISEKLTTYGKGERSKNVYPSGEPRKLNQQIVFLFTGQGSQYPQMGRDLYDTYPRFRETLEKCDTLLQPLMDKSLIELIYNDETAEALIHQTGYTQPVIFAIEYALAQLWQSWGIKPAVVMGHSIGEYVAACLAGIFTLEDGLKLVTARGRLMQSLPENGSMASIIAREEKVFELIKPYGDKVSIAALNAPENIVISGDKGSIAEMMAQCTQNNIPSRLLQISHAIHSPLMEPILDEFQAIASKISYATPNLPIISNATGKTGGTEMANPDYWTKHIRQPVRFYESMVTLDKAGYELFLEVGTTSTLISLGMQCIPRNQGLWLLTLGLNNFMFNMRPHRPKKMTDWEPILQSLGQLYSAGIDIDWSTFDHPYPRKKVILPTYPFQRQKHWMPPVYEQDMETYQTTNTDSDRLSPEAVLETSSPPSHPVPKDNQVIAPLPNRRTKILSQTQALLHQASEIEITAVDYETPLLELGLDSLMLTRFMHGLMQVFDIEMEISWFFTKTDTFDKVVAFLDETVSTAWGQENAKPVAEVTSIQTPSVHRPVQELAKQINHIAPKANPDDNASAYGIVSQQLQLMTQQIDFLNTIHSGAGQAIEQATSQAGLAVSEQVSSLSPSENHSPTSEFAKSAHFRAMKFEEDQLSPQQTEFLTHFIARYNERTKKSKALAQQSRPIFADWINSLNFRKTLKEIIYPVVHDHSSGSRIWDIDGNEYIDLGMGYGVSFFGNKPPFITEAITQQLEKGFELGPQSDLAGEVAQLISELTGVERVAFCNTGSESVMVALRLARTVTGRNKIVLFSNDYHGTFDGVLAAADEQGNSLATAPGTPLGMVEDVKVLNYGTESSLETIRTHAHELAAILVEPVQSRRPGFQPKAFLQQLRKITAEAGIALIFDEVLTGFRIHPGGCQAWFNIQADIVTYGKIVGGGMPIGIVGGKTKYMNAVDGGFWQFGDDSYPNSKMTVFAGTFCKHPLTMAAAKAVLTYLKQQGVAVQEQVNRRTAYFADTLNAFFKQENVAIQIQYFGSVFRFESFGKYSLLLQPLDMELFFNLLLEKGVYTWERRVCFFSIAHTDEELEILINKVKDTIHELRHGGFML